MDTHKNARLTPKGREQMVRTVVDDGMTKAAAARQYHTTPKTVGKWVDRFLAEGMDGLRDRSSRPLSSPSQTPLATCAAVEALRRQRHTQQHIAGQLDISKATVSRILRRCGLSSAWCRNSARPRASSASWSPARASSRRTTTPTLLEEMNLPIAFHAGYNWNEQSMATMNKFISVHAIGFVFYNMVHLTNWIMNSLSERFPQLRTVWIESGLAWVPFIMQRLDNEYMMRSSEAPALKRRPSDYMRDMFFSSQAMETTDPQALEVTLRMIKAETQLLYSSDYPHWDFDLPSTIYDLPFLSEQAKRSILGGNAKRVFSIELPAGKLARVA